MDKLISDIWIRRTCQVIILSILTILLLVCLWATLAVQFRAVGHLMLGTLSLNFFELLSSPMKETLSPISVVATTVLPVILSTVIYEIDPDNPSAIKATLNRVGHVVFILAVIGVALSAYTLLIFSINSGPGKALNDLVASDADSIAVRSLIGMIGGFFALYLAQILGLKPK